MTELWFVTSLPVAHHPESRGGIRRVLPDGHMYCFTRNKAPTDNVLVRVDAAVQLEYFVSVAQFSLHLVVVLLVRHTEAVCDFHDSFVGCS